MIDLAQEILDALSENEIDIELVKMLMIKLAFKIDEYEK